MPISLAQPVVGGHAEHRAVARAGDGAERGGDSDSWRHVGPGDLGSLRPIACPAALSIRTDGWHPITCATDFAGWRNAQNLVATGVRHQEVSNGVDGHSANALGQGKGNWDVAPDDVK